VFFSVVGEELALLDFFAKFFAEIVLYTENFGNSVSGKRLIIFIILLVFKYKDSKKEGMLTCFSRNSVAIS
jgi:hypothetical protein